MQFYLLAKNKKLINLFVKKVLLNPFSNSRFGSKIFFCFKLFENDKSFIIHNINIKIFNLLIHRIR